MDSLFGTLKMSMRNSRDELPPLPGRLPIDRLTALGLVIAGAGWAFLIVAMLLGSAMMREGAFVAVLAMRADIVTVSQTAIFTGFALAAIGVLRAGFGVLNSFFEAVLDRSTAPKSAPAAKSSTATVTPVVMEPEFDPEPPPPIVPTRERFTRSTSSSASTGSGKRKGHNYVILSDGSVEVETLLGTRVFATLDEAKDFIR